MIVFTNALRFNQNVDFFEATFRLTLVKKNRLNGERRKNNAYYRKKPSHDWLGKDQRESAISVQSLSYSRILFVGRGRG